jgi:hypothetical protein
MWFIVTPFHVVGIAGGRRPERAHRPWQCPQAWRKSFTTCSPNDVHTRIREHTQSNEAPTITRHLNRHLSRPHNHNNSNNSKNALRLLQPRLAPPPHPVQGHDALRRGPSSNDALQPVGPRILAAGVVAGPRQGAPKRPPAGAGLAFAAEMLDAGRRREFHSFAGRVRDASARLGRRRRRRRGGTGLVVRSNRNNKALVAVEAVNGEGERDARGRRRGQCLERD